MKKKFLFPLLSLFALSLGAGSLLSFGHHSTVETGAYSVQPGDAAYGEESDWTPVTSAAGINTSDYYMFRVTYNSTFQYSTGVIDSDSGGGLPIVTDSFDNAKVFKFVQGTNGYIVNGAFEVKSSGSVTMSGQYLSLTTMYGMRKLQATDNIANAAEFVGYTHRTSIFTLKGYNEDCFFAAYEDSVYNPGKCDIEYTRKTDYDDMYAFNINFYLPLQLVSMPAPEPTPDVYSYIDLRQSYENDPTNNWESAGAKFAVCYQNKTGGETNNEKWSPLATPVDGKDHVYEFVVPQMNFTPNHAILVRLDSVATEGDWSKKWNQFDVTYANGSEVFVVHNWDAASTFGSVVIKGGAGEWTETTIDVQLADVKVNDQGNWEFYGDVVIEEASQIKSTVLGSWYDGKFTVNSPLTGIVTGDQTNNISINRAGTYKMYYNTATYTIHITTEEIQEAYAYATYFLENVGCDVTGENAPSGWATVKAAFENDEVLTNEARKVLVEFDNPSNVGDDIQRCTFLYDMALDHHVELDAFMKYVNGSDVDVIRESLVRGNNNHSIEMNSVLAVSIIAIIACLSISSVGVVIVIKKRKTGNH